VGRKRRRSKRGSSGSGLVGFSVVVVVLLVAVGQSEWLTVLAVLALLTAFFGWLVWFLVRRAGPRTPAAQQLAQRFGQVPAMSGGQFEVFVADVVRAMGYQATVLGGSGDQGVDIIATKDGQRVAVQCKNYRKPVGNKPVQEVFAGARHHRCNQAWVVAPVGYTKGAFELARSVGVLLFDANSIRKWIGAVGESEQAKAASAEEADGLEGDSQEEARGQAARSKGAVERRYAGRQKQAQAESPERPTPSPAETKLRINAEGERGTERYEKWLGTCRRCTETVQEFSDRQRAGKLPPASPEQTSWLRLVQQTDKTFETALDQMDRIEERYLGLISEDKLLRRAELVDKYSEIRDRIKQS
jgi:restriction system protein